MPRNPSPPRAVLAIAVVLLLAPLSASAQYSPSQDCAFVEQLFDQSSANVSWPRGSCCYAGPSEFLFYPPRFFCTNGRITRLVASSLKLSGPIPPSIGSLTALKRLELDGNKLNGSIPAEIGQLATLEFLDLSSNQLSGSIPTQLVALAKITDLDLNYNRLEGTIPDLSGMPDLYSVDMGLNALEGPVPALSALKKLDAIYLSYNRLSGPLPSLTGATKLRALSLDHNRLSGPLPTDLRATTTLTWLNLAGNNLSGNVDSALPSSLQDCFLANQTSAGGTGLYTCSGSVPAACLQPDRFSPRAGCLSLGSATQCAGLSPPTTTLPSNCAAATASVAVSTATGAGAPTTSPTAARAGTAPAPTQTASAPSASGGLAGKPGAAAALARPGTGTGAPFRRDPVLLLPLLVVGAVVL
ncbi:L domain-like protein [Gonapodya prolifera JEL478]|uniref:L domain-like protein n=1 Tax=Gonapodya prolifera (strain JEL478) TaxID=1344416 RepID=A0A139APJ5_GONPJ|nr:L domain-like protein [Gonapodya prolifera JEL478]|eukprot:KXS18648.1 L domain-like protein [Gonapodya prolifera JEL478]